jgi:hypothetical protein
VTVFRGRWGDGFVWTVAIDDIHRIRDGSVIDGTPGGRLTGLPPGP